MTRRVVWLCPLVAGCEGVQSALSPAGPVAREIAWLWWGMAIGAAVVFALVLVLLLYAIFRDPQRRRRTRPKRLIYAGGIALPIVTLSVLMPIGVRVGSGATAPAAPDAIRIHVTGHQWWWDIEYDLGGPSTRFTTANEFYVPTGEPVELILTSRDVIHSLWVPKLGGKLDLIPGRVNRLMLEADREGVFRGQCAEYCGIAHTQMALHVVAVSPEAFDDWVARQREPALPQTDADAEGAVLFRAAGCALCHTVRGIGAWGRAGPDLTHFGGRHALGAGVLVNTPENVAWWIAYNDSVKPRNRMPEYRDMPLEMRRRLAQYLETLE
jgi:cytochrome c oxidase subunit II